ncbi:hypothetical protein [Sphaerimonospora thailandensis]|uniref:Uncharacterized protein n=1 Tax=Sphaerimonospora thailandensis TaxID=795644 RepID=A0A8J3VYR9_9ACTN|nr:hypothetical protein [Sphaerimonospora thailandensis]GIH70354.1 hypothetical protein Mth01_26070 [Sphaerimonospora thailandensis]
MAAIIAGYSTASRSSSIARPGGTKKDDVLIVIHGCGSGGPDDMGISGGSGWVTIAERAMDGFGGGGTKVYRKILRANDPAGFDLTSASTSRSAAILLVIRGGQAAQVVAKISGLFNPWDDVTRAVAPAATPAGASGLEIRAGVGFSPWGTATWPTPDGYTPAAAVQAGSAVTLSAVSRPLVSSAAVGEQTLRTGTDVYSSHGVTILIPSGSSVPDAPDIAPWAPGRGSGLYRYMVHDLLSGSYITDIRPTDCSFDRRISEPGTFSATLPVSNAVQADQVARIVPRHSSDLSTGPGRITVRIWRAGVLWGEYWITGAVIERSRRGGITVKLRGSTLDAFLFNVPVESSRYYSGEQIANARSLIGHMQALSGANLGLLLQPGSSGVIRTLEAKAADDPTYGSALSDFARGFNGFEWLTDPTANSDTEQVERWWRWGYPRLTSDRVHVVSESPTGGDILEWREEIDALRGATRVRVRGGTPEAVDAEEGSEPVYSAWQSASAHLAAGWPRYGQRLDHPGESTSTSTLNNYAQRWIKTMAGAVRVYSATVALGARTTISPSSLGDQVRRIMVNEWWPRSAGGATFNQTQRLIGISITPVRRGVGKEEAKLILEEPTIADISDDRYPTGWDRHVRRLRRDVDRLSGEAKRVRPVTIAGAGDVPNPPNFGSPSVQSGQYASGDAYTRHRADTAAMHDTLRDLMNSLRARGFLE